jgi:hypothetical protein
MTAVTARVHANIAMQTGGCRNEQPLFRDRELLSSDLGVTDRGNESDGSAPPVLRRLRVLVVSLKHQREIKHRIGVVWRGLALRHRCRKASQPVRLSE